MSLQIDKRRFGHSLDMPALLIEPPSFTTVPPRVGPA